MRIPESELVQGSEAWHKFRAGGIGGSEIASVTGKNPYQTAYQLWQIKAGIKEAPDLSDNFAVKRGHALEPIARSIVNDLGYNFEPCIFQDDEFSFMKYSSDGFDQEKNELLEIKALGEKNHLIVKETNEPLEYYKDQLQWGMMIAKCEKIHFVSYCQSFPEPIIRIEVLADKQWQDNIKKQAAAFWKMVETKTAPELSERDFLDVSCEQLQKLAEYYKKITSEAKLLEDEIESVKSELKKFSAGRNVVGNGLKMFTSFRKGSVDYSKIPELKNVDLEKYRKKDSEVFYIKTI